jgi:hypothetical protein
MTPRSSLYLPSFVVCCVAFCAAAGACSSGTSAHPAGLSAGGSDTAEGGSAGSDAAGSTNQLGSDGGVSSDGGATTSDTAGEAAGGELGTGQPSALPSACAETAHWSGASSVVGVSSAGNETLLSVTADELDLAFLRDGALYVAQRAVSSAELDAGSPIAIPTGWSAARGASLSPDGLRLVLVSDPDQKKLGEITRLTRNAAFGGSVDESAFAAVNQDAVYTGKLYASPVISAGDDQLFFNSTFPLGASTVVVATRSAGNAWSAPLRLTPQLLDGNNTTRRLPSGVSADARTLFYFNEQSGQEEARFRASPSIDSPLYDMVSLGARTGAAPNAACNRLYSGSSNDVVVETD